MASLDSPPEAPPAAYTLQRTMDPRGEKFRLIITLAGSSQFALSGLHVSTTPQQIDAVVQGAILVHSSSSASMLDVSPPSSSSSPPSSTTTTTVMIKQRASLKQWHASACGYHALYNVRQMLLLGGATNDNDDNDDEVDFWALCFTYMRALQTSGAWPTCDFTDTLLDEDHMDFLIASDPVLRGNCTLLSEPENDATSTAVSATGQQPHGYLLACASHWMAAAWTPSSSSVLLVMDSHNKPVTMLSSAQDSAKLALDVVEAYRSEFCRKMREVELYKHHPHFMLSNLYDEGVPEYWKGREKDSLYWAHRPARVRLDIMFRELESARAFLARFQHRSAALASAHAPLLPRRVILPETSNVFTNLSSSSSDALNAYIRRDEYLPATDDSGGPATLLNRKRAPRDEIPGDAFDRQRVIPDFDQGKIESQVCLVVGTGGIGMNVALTLCRLGVHEICLVDFDTYDASNLTRQCLGTKLDVGERKTAAAMRNIRAHNLRTHVRELDCDVIAGGWPEVVREARKCTVVFNCCDAGKMLDFALNALCKELCVPYCVGQSFGWKFMSELYTGQPQHNCAFCEDGTRSTFSLAKSQLEHVMARLTTTYQGDLARLLHEDDAFRIDVDEVRRFEREVTGNGIGLPVTALADLEHVLQKYHDWAVEQLLPGRVSQARSLKFCAWPQAIGTRFVGSWVCPCLACGVFCVSHWTSYLTSTARRPPTTMLFNMDEGMTAEEQMAYTCGALSIEDRRFVDSPSSKSCQTCAAAQHGRREWEAYFGSRPVFLRPVPGEVSKSPQWDFDYVYGEEDRAAAAGADSPSPSPLLEPRVPALAPRHSLVQAPQTLEGWPMQFAFAPVLKTTEEDAKQWPRAIHAVESGVRSCIVFNASSLSSGGAGGAPAIRLKGCGNGAQGFPLEVKGDDKVSQSLRGCMFEDTCARELYMTEYIATRCGVQCGNRALGFFRYPRAMPGADHRPNPDWLWEAEQHTDKFCGVFETFGERRLGDGLLAGLERRLMATSSGGAWLGRLQVEAGKRGSDYDTATHVECGLPCVDFAQLVTAGEGEEDEVGLALQLARVLGGECGRVMRQLAQGGVCWGTFRDEMGIHCNAHSNNLVVLMPRGNNDDVDDQPFLGAVDFDFSFTRDAFVLQEEEEAGSSLFFPSDFDGIVHFEQTMGMKTSLAGCDFSSTGVSNNNSTENSEWSRLVRIAFRDTLVVAFEQALGGGGGGEAPTTGWMQRARGLVRLALEEEGD